MELPLSHRLYTAQQLRLLEKNAIHHLDIPSAELMQRAGSAAWQALLEHFPDVDEVVVFCGHGNNAGDGYVLAKLAAEQWLPVTVWQVSSNQLKDEALAVFGAAQEQGVTIKPFSQYQPPTHQHAVMVDALLGIGIRGDVRGDFKKAIDVMNASACEILALDIPSGLCADTGSILGAAVCADVTITFIGAKRGLFTAHGADYTGEVVLSDLSLPEVLFQDVVSHVELLDYHSIEPQLLPRLRYSHKGDFGHVLVIGGELGFGGAVIMAAEAALRVGAGCVSVATRAEHVSALLAHCPAVMAHAVLNSEQLEPLLAKASVVVLGPGLGQSDWAKALWKTAMESNLPLILDADGLNLLAQLPTQMHLDWILTPHPGEAARLLNTTVADIERDRFASATALQQKFHGAVVLKGVGSILCYTHDLEKELAVCYEGNSGMATAGMGDVLSGVLGGLRAQGWSAVDAVRIGVCLHAKAGDLASEEGERGLIATDLMSYLQYLVDGE